MSRKRADRTQLLFGYRSRVAYQPGVLLKVRGSSWLPLLIVVAAGIVLLMALGLEGMRQAGRVRAWHLIPVGTTVVLVGGVVWAVFLRRATSLRPREAIFDLRQGVLRHQVLLRTRVIPFDALQAVAVRVVGTRGRYEAHTLWQGVVELRLASGDVLGLAETTIQGESLSAIERAMPLAQLLEEVLGLSVDCVDFDPGIID